MVSFNGVGSGLDIQALIDASLMTRRRGIQLLQAKQAYVNTQQSAVRNLKGQVQSVKTSAEAFKSLRASLMSASSTSSNVTATATADATAGSYSVHVNTLAKAHRIGAAGWADRSTTPIGNADGVLQLRLGTGPIMTINTTTTMTLDDLAAAINEKKGDITASIINDGSPTDPYRLVLTSKKTGAANQISVVQNDTGLNLTTNSYEQPVAAPGNSGSFTGQVQLVGTYAGTSSRSYIVEIMQGGVVGDASTTYRVSYDGGQTWDDNTGAGYEVPTIGAELELGTPATSQGLYVGFEDNAQTLTAGDRWVFDAINPTIQAAQDATLTIDGIAVSSSTNTISDAIDGVSLTLLKAGEETTINVARSTSDVESKINAFISSYNSLIGGIRAQQKYNAETKEGGALLGDAVANRIVSDLSRAISNKVTGTTGTYSSLTEIGLTLDKTGVLSLNSEKLKKALDQDLDSVLEVLEGATSASTEALVPVSTPSAVPAGSYSVNITQAATKAQVVAPEMHGGILGGPETLTFTFTANKNDASPTVKNFSVNLLAGWTTQEILNEINNRFEAEGVGLVAEDDAGTFKVTSKEYGSNMEVTVQSDQSGNGFTGFGNVLLTNRGVDVQGSIGGQAATGVGAELFATAGVVSGLRIKYEGTLLGNIGSINVTQGAGAMLSSIASLLADDEKGPITARDKNLSDQIKLYDRRIAERQRQLEIAQERLRAQYAALDANLGRMRSQGEAAIQSLLALPR